jgi:photosystem II stability/assembly factor-like uncharacterized protein
MKSLLRFLVSFLLMNMVIYPQWTQTNGPFGGEILCFISHNSNLFAGTSGDGIYLSSDNGESWKAVNNGLSSYGIISFAASGNNLFAGTWTGVFLSTNNGTSWQSVNNGLMTGDYLEINDLAVSGSNLFAAIEGGVGISTNNGADWTIAQGTTTHGIVRALAVHGTNIYAGTTYGGVLLSTDNGVNWEQIGLDNLDVLDLAVLESVIVASTIFGGVFRSTDNGTNWTQVECWESNFTVSGSIIYAAWSFMSKSTDYGITWIDINGIADVHVIGVMNNDLFAGTLEGVYRSTDNGINWEQVNTGINNTIIDKFHIMGSKLVATVSSFSPGDPSYYVSDDNGESWAEADTALARLCSLYVSTFLSRDDDLFAGTGSGVYHSTDKGISWSDAGLNDKSVITLSYLDNYLFAGTNAGGLYRSADDGKTWNYAGYGSFVNVSSLAVLDQYIFAVTPYTYRSGNLGQSWTHLFTAFHGTTKLAVIGNKIYSGDYTVTVSSDYGQTWKEMNSGLPDTRVILSFAVTDSTLFALVSPGLAFSSPCRIFQCVHNDTVWTPADSGLNADAYITSISARNSFLYTTIYGRGIWKKSLSGITSAEDLRELPDDFLLEQNYPNPFNPNTVIEYTIPYLSHVTVTVYDLLGRETAKLVDEEKAAGKYKTEFNASNLTSGMYLYQIKSGSYIRTKKMMVIK